MDTIHINGMEFYAYHGALPEENRLGQLFTVDVQLRIELQPAGVTDDLAKTVNYAEAYEEVKAIMESVPVQLIETLAERIAAKLFDRFPLVEALRVKLNKPNPPIPGHLAGVAVEIYRERPARG
ncbi:MAG TPA: dihydroneopterin aldolase [Bacilli bacterium]|nr:dihydroneopterin aldolase [Bacilli bacterium]